MRRGSARGGFSLVEVVVAVAVLSILLLGLFATLNTAQKYDMLNREHQAASEAAFACMDRLLAEASTGSVAQVGTFAITYKANGGEGSLSVPREITAGDGQDHGIYMTDGEHDWTDPAAPLVALGHYTAYDMGTDNFNATTTLPGGCACANSYCGAGATRTLVSAELGSGLLEIHVGVRWFGADGQNHELRLSTMRE